MHLFLRASVGKKEKGSSFLFSWSATINAFLYAFFSGKTMELHSAAIFILFLLLWNHGASETDRA